MAAFAPLETPAAPRGGALPAAMDERRISTLSVDLLDEEAEAAPEAQRRRASLPPLEAQNHELRERVKRRNQLLGIIRDAYLRDVVAVKEQLFEAEAKGNRYRPSHSELCRLPSLDMRHAISLFAPSECYLNVEPCGECGGQLEIVHVEYTKLKLLEAEHAALQEQYDDAQKRIGQLEFENKAVRESEMLAKVRGKEEKRAMMDLIAQLRGERDREDNILITTLQEKIVKLEGQLSKTAEMFQQLERLQFDLYDAKETSKSQGTEITGLKKTIKVKDVKMKRMQKEIVKEKAQSRRLREEKAEIIDIGAKLEAELQSRIQDMTQEIEVQVTHNDGMGATLERLREEAEESANAMTNMKIEFEQTLEEEAAARERVTEELSAVRAGAAKAQRQLDQMRNQLRMEQQKQKAVAAQREVEVAQALAAAEAARKQRAAARQRADTDTDDDLSLDLDGPPTPKAPSPPKKAGSSMAALALAAAGAGDDDDDDDDGGILAVRKRPPPSTPVRIKAGLSIDTDAEAAGSPKNDIAAAVAEGKAAAARAAKEKRAAHEAEVKARRNSGVIEGVDASGGMSLGVMGMAAAAASRARHGAAAHSRHVADDVESPLHRRKRSGPQNLVQELQELEAENHQLRAKHQKVTTVFLKAKERIQALKHDMVLSDDTIDTLSRQIAEVQTESQQKDKDIAFKDERIQGLNERLEVLEQELFRLRRKIRNVGSAEEEMSGQLEGETAQREAAERLVTIFRLRYDRLMTRCLELADFLATTVRQQEFAHLHPGSEPEAAWQPGGSEQAQVMLWAQRLDGVRNIEVGEISFKEVNQRRVREEEAARRGQTLDELERADKERRKRMKAKTADPDDWSSSDDDEAEVAPLLTQEGLLAYLQYRLSMGRCELSLDLRSTTFERDQARETIMARDSEVANLKHGEEKAQEKIKSLEERIIAAAGETKGSKERAMLSIGRIEQLEQAVRDKDRSIEMLQAQTRELVGDKTRALKALAEERTLKEELEADLGSRRARDEAAVESLSRAAKKELQADELVERHLNEVKEAEKAVEAEKEKTAEALRQIDQIYIDRQAEIDARVSTASQTVQVVLAEAACQAEWDPPSMSLVQHNALMTFPHPYGVGAKTIVVCRPKGQLAPTVPQGQPVLDLASSAALGTTVDSVVPDVIADAIRSPRLLDRPASAALYASTAAALAATDSAGSALSSPFRRAGSPPPPSLSLQRPSSGYSTASTNTSPTRSRPGSSSFPRPSSSSSLRPTSAAVSRAKRPTSAAAGSPLRSLRPSSGSPVRSLRPRSALPTTTPVRQGQGQQQQRAPPLFESDADPATPSRPQSAAIVQRPLSAVKRPPGLDPMRRQQLQHLTKTKPVKTPVPAQASRIRFYNAKVGAPLSADQLVNTRRRRTPAYQY